jgi:hypothetical protein
MKFEIGETVRCINSDTPGSQLIFGALYQVTGSRGGFVSLDGFETMHWVESRFEPVDPLVESILEIQKKNA